MDYLKNKNIFSYVHVFLAISTLLWLNNGVFSYIEQYYSNVVKLSIFGIWFLVAIFLQKKFLLTYVKRIFPFLIFYIILICVNLFIPSYRAAEYIANLRYIFIIYSIFIFYFNNKMFIKFILFVILFDFLYIGINTYIHLLNDPYISRNLSTGIAWQKSIYGNVVFKAVGSFSYAYGLVMTGLLFFYNTIYLKKHRLINFIVTMAILFILIKMNFVISIFLFIGFSIHLIISKQKYYYIFMLTAVLLSVVLLLNLSDIIILLSKFDFLKKSHILDRLEEIAWIFQGVNVQWSDTMARLELYIKSAVVFFNSPLIGNLTGEGLGGHSAWLDILGQFGLLNIPMFVFFIREYKYIITKFDNGAKIFVKNCYLYCLVLGVINTMFTAGMMIALYIVVPFGTAYYILQKEKVKNENIMVLQHYIAPYSISYLRKNS